MARRAVSRAIPPPWAIEEPGDPPCVTSLNIGRHPGSGVVENRMRLLAGGYKRV